MKDFDEFYALELEIEIEEEEKLINKIVSFITERELEDGESPDEDTIIEALEIPEDLERIVSKGYSAYWRSL